MGPENMSVPGTDTHVVPCNPHIVPILLMRKQAWGTQAWPLLTQQSVQSRAQDFRS
jgi:hypothetical protein